MNSHLKLKSSLTCSYCFKILKCPIELPCDDLICKEHLKEKEVVQKNEIKCLSCKREFEVKDHDFNLNESIQEKINSKDYLSVLELTLKTKIKESIKLFYSIYEEFISSKTKLDLDCHEHFQEIRFQIDLQREKLKEKIDEIYMEMIDKSKEYESSYLKKIDEKLSASFKSFEKRSVEDDLQDLEETFRNPNLLIESIRDRHQKQEETIQAMKSKLNEIKQIKDDLKASNEFIPFLSFNIEMFGRIFFDDQFKSLILTEQQSSDLIKLCEFNPKTRYKLLYRASEHGFRANDFHSKCDGHANTLTIFKASETSFVFGAFTSAIWESSQPGKYKPDSNAFVFSLTNNEFKPCKMKIHPNKHQNAIYCYYGCGPIFGSGHDIYIAPNANTNTSCLSNFSSTYLHPQYEYGSTEAQSYLAGTYKFQVSEIEIYEIEN